MTMMNPEWNAIDGNQHDLITIIDGLKYWVHRVPCIFDYPEGAIHGLFFVDNGEVSWLGTFFGPEGLLLAGDMARRHTEERQ